MGVRGSAATNTDAPITIRVALAIPFPARPHRVAFPRVAGPSVERTMGVGEVVHYERDGRGRWPCSPGLRILYTADGQTKSLEAVTCGKCLAAMKRAGVATPKTPEVFSEGGGE